MRIRGMPLPLVWVCSTVTFPSSASGGGAMPAWVMVTVLVRSEPDSMIVALRSSLSGLLETVMEPLSQVIHSSDRVTS